MNLYSREPRIICPHCHCCACKECQKLGKNGYCHHCKKPLMGGVKENDK